MAKQTKNNSEETQPNKAQNAFDEYKQRMDQGYQAHLAMKQSSGSGGSSAEYPMYVLSDTPPIVAPMMAPPAPMTKTDENTTDAGTSVIDGLAKLLDLSIKTANTTLTGWMTVMNKFYGVSEEYEEHHGGSCQEHGYGHGGYPSGCHGEHVYTCDCNHNARGHHDCDCDDCHPGVHNCC